jgi:hypothetical protein
MNRLEVFTFVRDTLEVDSTDLPDSIMKVWLRDAFDRTLALEQRWRFYEVEPTFNTISNQQAYTVASINATLKDVRALTETTNEGQTLMYVSHDEAERMWGQAVMPAGVPYYWSFWNASVYLWPKPSGVRTYRARGYRLPTYTWYTDVEGDVEIDCPAELHVPLAYYVASKGYLKQEDPELAQTYDQMYVSGVQVAIDALQRNPVAVQPRVLGGATRRPITYEDWVRRSARIS